MLVLYVQSIDIEELCVPVALLLYLLLHVSKPAYPSVVTDVVMHCYCCTDPAEGSLSGEGCDHQRPSEGEEVRDACQTA